jgi:hypothetical protein
MKNRMISALLLAMIFIGVASGEVIATTTRTLPNFFTDSAVHFIPLNNAGSTLLPFVTTTRNQRIVISFNAECSVRANNFSTFVNLDILVDGVAASPSSDDNAFCSAHGSFLAGGWVSAVSTSVFVVPSPGLHFVRIRGFLGTTFVFPSSWTIDDSSTVIMK